MNDYFARLSIDAGVTEITIVSDDACLPSARAKKNAHIFRLQWSQDSGHVATKKFSCVEDDSAPIYPIRKICSGQHTLHSTDCYSTQTTLTNEHWSPRDGKRRQQRRSSMDNCSGSRAQRKSLSKDITSRMLKDMKRPQRARSTPTYLKTGDVAAPINPPKAPVRQESTEDLFKLTGISLDDDPEPSQNWVHSIAPVRKERQSRWQS